MTDLHEWLQIGVLNLAGWTDRNRLLREHLVKETDLDILCVTETHLTGNNEIEIDGYKFIGHNRGLLHKQAPKGSGGTGILIKEHLLQMFKVSVVDKSYEGILGISLQHNLSDYVCHVYSCYLPPENSTWGRDSTSFYSHLLSEIYMYCDRVDSIILCGDFNSRIGSSHDYVLEVDDIPPRKSLDTVTNQHGRSLLEFLQEAKFCTLNGRGNPDSDGFTCCTSRGMSVVDYVLISHDGLKECKNFCVHNMVDLINRHNLQHLLHSHSKAPDHSLLTFELCINVLPSQYVEPVQPVSASPQLLFNFNKPRPNFLTSQLSTDALVNVIDRILVNRESQGELDQIYHDFCNIIIEEMKANIPHHDTSKPVKKRFKPRKGFWDDELQNLWQELHKAEKTLRKSTNRLNRRTNHEKFKIAQRSFDRLYRRKERAFLREQSTYLSTLQTNNPKQFWQELNKLGPKRKRKIPMEVYDEDENIVTDTNYVLNKWKTDFEGLYSSNNITAENNPDPLNNVLHSNIVRENLMKDPLYFENANLNRNFTLDEVKRVIMKCKNGKSSGVDRIPYEILKNDKIIDVLTNLYQLCFDTNLVPAMWSKSIISPIEKSKDNDPRLPLHYRGISLICCSAKIYSSLINNRITEHLNNANLICEEQNGFRKGRSCTDHIFSLNAIVEHHIDNNRQIFAAFIDFQKAFDCINRDNLFSKILDKSVDGKIYFAIKSLYKDNEASVRVNDYLTDWFTCSNGVRQGDTLSPTLFSIYINDLAEEINVLDIGVNMGDFKVSNLLYADDVVIVANNENDLQTMLNTLHSWSKRWAIDINKTKSKIVHFRKANVTKSNFDFKVGEKNIAVDHRYKYLGTYFTEFMNFTEHADILGDSGGRALGSVVAKLKKSNHMNYSTYTKLYESGVTPIVDYGSEVWGYKNYNKPNIIQNKAMRVFLGVHRFAPVAGLEGDMAWLSPQYRRWLSILRYWNRLLKMNDDRLPKKMFNYMLTQEESSNWCNNVSNILEVLELTESFINRLQVDISDCREKLVSRQQAQWLRTVMEKPKLRFYAVFKNSLKSEKYVEMNLSSYERSVLAQIRLGILKLHIETGRFTNTKLEDRVCKICNNGEIEDETHFLFNCDAYEIPRIRFIEKIYEQRPHFHYLEDRDQLHFIFYEIPRVTAKFIITCLEIRKNHLYN